LDQQRNSTPLPQLEYAKKIDVWNTAARPRLNNYNPTWVRDLACDIPEANRKHRNISNDPVLNACHPKGLKLVSRK